MKLIKDDSLLNHNLESEIGDFCIKRTNHEGKLTKLSDVFNRIPYGYIIKSETGMGATTLELRAKRNSIIVEPLRVTASSKAASHKGSLYVGSKTKLHGSVSNQEIKAYHNSKAIPYKKILVVADSLPKLVNIIGSVLFDEYFILIDEVDSFQLDSGFRASMEKCIDIYKRFPKTNRALISATKIDFSDPELIQETKHDIFYEGGTPRAINVIHTNDVKAMGYDIIKMILNARPADKIMVAFNSVDGCRSIANKLVADEVSTQETVKIMCSAGSKFEVGKYYHELQGDRLPGRLCFVTSAYFTGFDLHDTYHLISLSSYTNNRISALSDGKLKQIAGRSRDKLLSETIIHDTVPNHILKEETSTVKELEEAAEKELTALGCIDKNFQANPLLKDNLKAVRDLIVKHTTKVGFPLVREHNDPKRGYVVSYFNIDAYLESEWVKSIYAYPTGLWKALEQDRYNAHQIEFYGADASFIFDDKSVNKELREISVAEAIKSIKDRSIGDLKGRLMSEDVSRTEKRLIDIYLHHYEYIDKEQLLSFLEKFGGGRDIRTLNKLSLSLLYESLPAKNVFKHVVQSYLPAGSVFTGKQLLSIWNLIFADAGMHYLLKSSVTAVRHTRIYFGLSRQRDKAYLIKSPNPLKVKVITPRKTVNPEQLQNLVTHSS